ncbi:hypothetical protein [Azomonas macrocytogenes]|uniref:Uncharacterized protein n=1 Tax=Azomonas macrocytogenes TaxID=69962 RepID=A0A839T0P1_AZOMA|nr:hypothetical protein [Azomonas macrocytogenes]MBB3103137.1 hypothetical protein [Azomonas macrocytogenes]
MYKIIIAALLCLAANSTFAQTITPATDWGSLIGTHYAKAKICGASSEDLAAYKVRNRQAGQLIYGEAEDYGIEFSQGFDSALNHSPQAIAANPGSVSTNMCAGLLHSIGHGA